ERNVAIAVWMSTAIAGAAAGPIMGGLLLEFFWWGSVFLINVPIVIVTVFAIIAVAPPNIANQAKHWDLTSTIWAMFTMLGAIMGGLLLEFFWWGSVFLINLPIVVVRVFATIAVAPPNIANPAKQWDLTSSIWAMFTRLGGVMAIKELANSHRNMWVFSTAVVIGIIGLLLFIFRQRKLDEPLLDTAIFRNRMFTGGTITAGLMMFNVAGVELMTTQRFQTAADFSALQAGA